ncbi:hypothetical protein ACFV7R_15240 [Streptomyces sp. NPDC059866]|uniref:hypothetical protein n=1 Tax=Streptomyces sp. NPDC059866 TaxID=3346978 RepID=UPI00365B6179
MRRHVMWWKGRCREPAALTAALAVALTLLLWGAPAASAGGPTSVLVVSPESTEAAAQYSTEKEHGELQRLLGGQDGTGSAGPGMRAGRAAGAWWAIPGLAVGLALGAGGTLLIRRAAARPVAGPPRVGPHRKRQPRSISG